MHVRVCIAERAFDATLTPTHANTHTLGGEWVTVYRNKYTHTHTRILDMHTCVHVICQSGKMFKRDRDIESERALDTPTCTLTPELTQAYSTDCYEPGEIRSPARIYTAHTHTHTHTHTRTHNMHPHTRFTFSSDLQINTHTHNMHPHKRFAYSSGIQIKQSEWHDAGEYLFVSHMWACEFCYLNITHARICLSQTPPSI